MDRSMLRSNLNTFARRFLAGFLLNAAAALPGLLLGEIRLTLRDPQLLRILWLLFFQFFLASVEEVIFRCLIYAKLRDRTGKPLLSAAAASLAFALWHLQNPGIGSLAFLTIFAAGLLLTVIYEQGGGSFLPSAAFHTGWNYTQSVLLGLPNSGILPSASVFGVLSADSGTSVRRLFRLPLFYDPAFGLEGSLFALCLFCAAAAFLFLKGTRTLKE